MGPGVWQWCCRAQQGAAVQLLPQLWVCMPQ
jgi:hypothetical protein